MNSGYFKTVDQTFLHYSYSGSGPLDIIVLHGGLGDSREMTSLVNSLDPVQFRVIQIDFRGHGLSYHGPADLTYELYASDVFNLMDELGIKKAGVAGYSDGAVAALIMAYTQPDRVKCVAAISPDSGSAGWVEKTDLDATFIEIAQSEEMRADYDEISPEPSKFDLLLSRVKALWGSEKHLDLAKLRDIKAFCWIVGSESDEYIKKEDLELIKNEIPNSDTYFFFDLKHGELITAVAGLSIGNDHVLTSILRS